MPARRREPVSSRSNSGHGNKRSIVRRRDRYVMHACERCRAAKVRCNGAMPCSYCVSRDPDSCHYSGPGFQEGIARGSQHGPQDVDLLSDLMRQQGDKLNTISERISNLEKIHSHHHGALTNFGTRTSWTEEPLPLFQNSTSAFFSFRIVDANLRANRQPSAGTISSDENLPNTPSTSFSILHDQIIDDATSDVAEGGPKDSLVSSDLTLHDTQGYSTRPLDQLEGAEIIRLIQKFQDLAGIMYPMVDVARLEQLVRELWTSEPRNIGEKGRSSRLCRDDLATLHVSVAIALVMENENGLELIQNLHDSIWPDIDSMIWNTKVDLRGLILITLMTLYYYYANKWRKAWRLIGNATRILLELGLNRQIVLSRSFPDAVTYSRAVNTIWTIFILEQQLTYSLGLSAAAYGTHIDPRFPRPVDAPYLEAMIQYARIGTQARESLLGENRASQTVANSFYDATTYFQYRLDGWRKSIDTEFQFPSTGERTDRWNQLLRTILHLRANNLRIAISRCVLFENEIQEITPPGIWDTSVEAAADTLHLVERMDSFPTTCCFQKSRSNYFLIAALGMSFLAISQNLPLATPAAIVPRTVSMAPATHMKARQTAVACLNLLRSRADTSQKSRYLWERFHGLALRLNILELPVSTSNPVGAEDWAGTMRTSEFDELLINHEGPAENPGLFLEMIPSLDMVLDQSFLTDVFASNAFS